MPYATRVVTTSQNTDFPHIKDAEGLFVTLQNGVALTLCVTEGDTSKGTLIHSGMEFETLQGCPPPTRYVKWGTSLKEDALSQGGTRSHTC